MVRRHEEEVDLKDDAAEDAEVEAKCEEVFSVLPDGPCPPGRECPPSVVLLGECPERLDERIAWAQQSNLAT